MHIAERPQSGGTHQGRALTLHRNPDIGCCSGMPISSVREFLRELVMLAGQDDTVENPELELQIGEVVSRTSVEMIDEIEYLTVTASLPVSEQSRYFPARTEGFSSCEAPPQAASISWNAASQCYVATRRTPTQDLRDDRSVMDTILLTTDEAIGWQALLEKLHLR
jgi:hypothetical protein